MCSMRKRKSLFPRISARASAQLMLPQTPDEPLGCRLQQRGVTWLQRQPHLAQIRAQKMKVDRAVCRGRTRQGKVRASIVSALPVNL